MKKKKKIQLTTFSLSHNVSTIYQTKFSYILCLSPAIKLNMEKSTFFISAEIGLFKWSWDAQIMDSLKKMIPNQEISRKKKINIFKGFFCHCGFLPQNVSKDFCFVFVYLSSLAVVHLSDALRGPLVVAGDSARIQDETTESSAMFFNVLGV